MDETGLEYIKSCVEQRLEQDEEKNTQYSEWLKITGRGNIPAPFWYGNQDIVLNWAGNQREAEAFRNLSLCTLASEHNSVSWNKSASFEEWRQFYNQTRITDIIGNPEECYYCSNTVSHIYERRVKLFHVHRATLTERLAQLDTVDPLGKIKCSQCIEGKHYAAASDRLPILMHDGILNNHRENNNLDQFHFDEVNMQGSPIRDITHGFISMYEMISKHRPVDVIAAFGYTDLQQGAPTEGIMSGIEDFAETVMACNSNNTVRIAQLVFLPEMSLLPNDTHLPRVDRTWDIIMINKYIDKLNEKLGNNDLEPFSMRCLAKTVTPPLRKEERRERFQQKYINTINFTQARVEDTTRACVKLIVLMYFC